ncbi:metacaspase-1 [Drosophila miranda]|uniref:metacaspase-1 n=1 Tax=Drosophila miranda TaxID=7229 RepID=UPI0007E7B668|nr:metacaspase-1 [Drosophila miranda]
MQLDARLSLSIVVLLLVGRTTARPTFDKIAGALIDALDDRPQYYPPPPRPGHAYGPGPLIHEGYEQGYDYYYGGGYGYGYQQGPPPPPPPPPGAYGYYPPPQRVVPSSGYYPRRAQEPYSHAHGHQPRDQGYSQGYGRSIGSTGTPGSTGGYKQRGY